MPGAAFDDAAAGIAVAGAVAAQVPGSAFADAAMLASTGRRTNRRDDGSGAHACMRIAKAKPP